MGHLRMLSAGQTTAREVERADHDCQHVVEVVRNAAGKLTDQLHFLHLTQLRLGGRSLGHLVRQRSGALGYPCLELGVQTPQRLVARPLPLRCPDHSLNEPDDHRDGEHIEPHGDHARGPCQPKVTFRRNQKIVGQQTAEDSRQHPWAKPAKERRQHHGGEKGEEREPDQ